VGERLVVEGGHLLVAGAAVERDRLVQEVAGLEPHGARAGARSALLELVQEPAAEPEAARRLGEPHALDVDDLGAGALERAAADRLGAQVGDDHLAAGRPQLVRLRGAPDQRVERRAGAALELGEVPAQALARVGVLGVDRHDLDHRGGQQALDVAHRADQALALPGGQRIEQ